MVSEETGDRQQDALLGVGGKNMMSWEETWEPPWEQDNMVTEELLQGQP